MSTRDQDNRPSILPLSGADEGKRAVKTTIVGGQPPGNQRPMQPVPVGLEQLMAMAAVSDEFSDALSEDREAALEASGVELTSTERAILGSVDDDALQRMVAGVGMGIPEQDRRGFLNMSAAAVLALVGGGSLAAGAAGCDRTSKGHRPDHPAPTGARPDRPEDDQPVEKKTGAETESETEAETETEPETKKPDAGRPPPPKPPTGARPDRPKRPDRPRPTRGARLSRPPRLKIPNYQGKTGARPDRPDNLQSETGARPDRPPKKKDKPKKPKKPKKPPKQPPPRNYPNRGMSIQRPLPTKKED